MFHSDPEKPPRNIWFLCSDFPVFKAASGLHGHLQRQFSSPPLLGKSAKMLHPTEGGSREKAGGQHPPVSDLGAPLVVRLSNTC